MSQYDNMTYAELTAQSAKLYDEYYALKAQIEEVNLARQRRGKADEIQRNLAELSGEQKAELAKQLNQTIVPVSIKSDEAVVGTGGQIRRWLAKAIGVSAVK